MSIYKIPLPLNILEAARERITWTLNTLPRVCVSFSGGKDSGLMLHLTAELARQMGVVCGRGRNPTLRLWPAIFSGEIDVFPSERRNMGQEIGR